MTCSSMHFLPVQLSFQGLQFDLPALLWSSRWIRANTAPTAAPRSVWLHIALLRVPPSSSSPRAVMHDTHGAGP